MKEFEKNYEMDRYGYELKNYYVEWACGFNKKRFGTLKDACQFADTIKEQGPEIYKIERVVI
jgi:hypothetical protein